MTGPKLVVNRKTKLHTSCTAHCCVTDDSIHLRRTANVFKKHEKFARVSGWKVYKDPLEDTDIDGTIILKEMLKKMNLRLRTGFICFTGETSTETSGLRCVTFYCGCFSADDLLCFSLWNAPSLFWRFEIKRCFHLRRNWRKHPVS